MHSPTYGRICTSCIICWLSYSSIPLLILVSLTAVGDGFCAMWLSTSDGFGKMIVSSCIWLRAYLWLLALCSLLCRSALPCFGSIGITLSCLLSWIEVIDSSFVLRSDVFIKVFVVRVNWNQEIILFLPFLFIFIISILYHFTWFSFY